MEKSKKNALSRRKRKLRVRRRIFGTSERPRLSVFRSDKHIYCQAIDDSSSVTLAESSSRALVKEGELAKGSDISAAEKVGAHIAKKILDKGIKGVVFDRGSYRYHGRVKALAEKAREGGLSF